MVTTPRDRPGGLTLTREQQDEFDDLLKRVRELQPLPAVALRLIAMSEDARFSAQDLAEAVRVDQALTLKVLRQANSPTLGLPRRITSIREAIVLLGFREVRSMALSSCVVESTTRDMFYRAAIDYDVFWINSLVVAHLAQVLAIADGTDQDQAFTAGLVHNIGRLAFAQQRPGELAECALEAKATRRLVHDVQQERYGFADCELGAAVADGWSFPQPLVESIRNHAHPLSTLPDRHSLDAIVARARRYARSHAIADGLDVVGIAPLPDLEWQDPLVRRPLQRLGGIAGVVDRAKAHVDIRG